MRVLRISSRSKINAARRILDFSGTPSAPFDPTEIRFSTHIYSLYLLLSRIREGDLDLSPEFQRRDVWTDQAASRLVESLLIRIPLPAFYVDASRDDHWTVIDGQQRLTALARFVFPSEVLPNKLRSLQRLRLKGLEYLSHYDGLTFEELPRGLQRRILETQVTVSLVEHGTPEQVKFNIFKRINTGGVPLSAQEIRHAMYQGPATLMLARLASSPVFRDAIGRGVSSKRMTDQEYILRALAFMLTPYDQYESKSFDEFLNLAMKRLNDLPEDQLSLLADRFLRSIELAYQLFGRDAFRKVSPNGKRQAINKALFEVWTVQLSKVTASQAKRLLVPRRRNDLLQRFQLLLEDAAFWVSISIGTEKSRRIRTRFAEVERLLEEVLL